MNKSPPIEIKKYQDFYWAPNYSGIGVPVVLIDSMNNCNFTKKSAFYRRINVGNVVRVKFQLINHKFVEINCNLLFLINSYKPIISSVYHVFLIDILNILLLGGC